MLTSPLIHAIFLHIKHPVLLSPALNTKGINMPLLNRKYNGPTVQPSIHKLQTLKELSHLGVKLSDGYDYNLYDHVLPESSLDETRQRLSSIKDSLSQSVVEERKQ